MVLLSGGLDSAVALYWARKRGFRCLCLIFDYGQRHKKEIASARRIAQSANCRRQIVKINLPWKGSALLDGKIALPKRAKGIPSTYVPARNIIFLSFALSYAEAIKAEAVVIGAHSQDYSGYPDCRPRFYRAFRQVVATGTKAGAEGRAIKVYAPLIQKSKAEIIRLGRRLKVPLQWSWSCYRGGRRPCNECDSCYYRAKGFREAGIADPLCR